MNLDGKRVGEALGGVERGNIIRKHCVRIKEDERNLRI